MAWTPNPELADRRLTINVGSSNATPVVEWVWRTWSGRRFVDSVEHHGPVFFLGTDRLAEEQHRTCPCCQPSRKVSENTCDLSTTAR